MDNPAFLWFSGLSNAAYDFAMGNVRLALWRWLLYLFAGILGPNFATMAWCLG